MLKKNSAFCSSNNANFVQYPPHTLYMLYLFSIVPLQIHQTQKSLALLQFKFRCYVPTKENSLNIDEKQFSRSHSKSYNRNLLRMLEAFLFTPHFQYAWIVVQLLFFNHKIINEALKFFNLYMSCYLYFVYSENMCM